MSTSDYKSANLRVLSGNTISVVNSLRKNGWSLLTFGFNIVGFFNWTVLDDRIEVSRIFFNKPRQKARRLKLKLLLDYTAADRALSNNHWLSIIKITKCNLKCNLLLDRYLICGYSVCIQTIGSTWLLAESLAYCNVTGHVYFFCRACRWGVFLN